MRIRFRIARRGLMQALEVFFHQDLNPGIERRYGDFVILRPLARGFFGQNHTNLSAVVAN